MSNRVDQKLKDRILKSLSYTNRDYDSIVNELLDLFQGDNPISDNWNNMSSADPLFLMLHLMAAHKDILNYQIDYSVLEGNMSTAREYSSIVRGANAFGYKVPGSKAGYVACNIKNNSDSNLTLKPFEAEFKDAEGNYWLYIDKEDLLISPGETKSVGLYQGTALNYEFLGSGVDPLSLTKVLTSRQVSIGTVGPIQEASRIIVKNENTITPKFTEVQNVNLTNDKETYELNRDTQTSYYIRFHQDAEIDTGATYTLQLLATRGDGVLAATGKLTFTGQNHNDIDVTLVDGSFVQGRAEPTAQELKNGFKRFFSKVQTLVTLEDYKNYILYEQTAVPNIIHTIVFDGDSNTSSNTNTEIEIFGPTAPPPFNVQVFVIKNENGGVTGLEPDEITNLANDLQTRKIASIKLDIYNATPTPIKVSISGVGTDSAKAKVREIVRTYINGVGIGETVSVGDIYSLIMANPHIAQSSRNLIVKLYTTEDNIEITPEPEWNEKTNGLITFTYNTLPHLPDGGIEV